MSDVFFTSDTHYGHANILKYSNRPFKTVDEMNEEMILRWNELVKPDDSCYHLGDFALCPTKQAINIARRLNGNKFLVWGNHDKRLRREPEFISKFAWAKDMADIKIAEQSIVLCHYALKTWNKFHRGAWSLYGHSHGSLKDDPNALQVDVGVDCWDYSPVPYDVLLNTMAKKTWKPIDHHGVRGDGY